MIKIRVGYRLWYEDLRKQIAKEIKKAKRK